MMDGASTTSDARRPASAVGTGVGLAGLAGLAAWIMLARNFGAVAEALGVAGLPARADGPYAALASVVACGLPMVIWSLLIEKVHLRASTGIDWGKPRSLREVADTSLVKIAGLWATWGIIAVIYCIARWYWRGPYLFSMEVLGTAAPVLVALSIPYVIWLDRRLVEPRDGSWHFGMLVAGQPGWDRAAVANHLRSWTVKGFFLAFMLSIVPGNFASIVGANVPEILQNPVWIAEWLVLAMFVVDVQFATVGYVLTMKPLDAHIRTANPYLGGWLAALICYPPFILMGEGGPLNYQVNTGHWGDWLAGYPALIVIWGALLVLLTGIYAWATVAFGLRFSNLTHRGILTHGPYRLTKHPAYVAKNLYWWLATLPFLTTSGSWTDAVRNTAILALVSAVYYWRARTEEKHLMADPVYRDYAAWADRHAPVPRLINWVVGRRPRPADASSAPEAQPAE